MDLSIYALSTRLIHGHPVGAPTGCPWLISLTIYDPDLDVEGEWICQG